MLLNCMRYIVHMVHIARCMVHMPRARSGHAARVLLALCRVRAAHRQCTCSDMQCTCAGLTRDASSSARTSRGGGGAGGPRRRATSSDDGSGRAAAPAGRRARARSPRCMRFGRACPCGSPASFERTRARLWGALRGPQNPQRWPWSPRSHTSHFARVASPLALRTDEGTCYGHSRLLAAAGNGRALAGVAGARSPKARFLALVAAGAAVGARRA